MTGWPRITAWILAQTRDRKRQVAWTVGLVAAPVALTFALLPPLDYLPPVKRAAIDAYFSFPPGMSPEAIDREIISVVRERMAPYMRGDKEPKLKNWYVLVWPGGGTIGARVVEEGRIGELERVVRDEIVVGFPDTRAFANEGELFGGFGGSARAIQIHLQSGDTKALNAAAEAGRNLLQERFPEANVQTWPNTDAAEPELRITADDRRLAEAGWTRSELGTVVRTLGAGTWLGEYFDGDRRMDIILRGEGWATPEDLAQLPVATTNGSVVSIGELAQLETVTSAAQVRRVDRRRTVTLTIDPPQTLSLEEALSVVQKEVVPKLRDSLPMDASVQMSGSADQLDKITGTMGKNFALALLVLFLLLGAMFKSLKDAAIVIASLPLAVLGGVLGLRVLGWFAFQPLDLLSMIGFIMLLGMVVNNAILLIAQTREAQAEGADIDRALEIALNQRLRPILIAALTGVVGALPMAMNPGPGAIIYRGLAAVTVGGVGFSLVFTAVLIPAVLRLIHARRAAEGPSAATVDYPPLRHVA